MSGEARIAWVERGLDLAGLAAGLGLWLAVPAARLAVTAPMMLVLGGVVLLASGLARDLARIALEGRPTPATPDRRPGELRLCLESTVGLAAVTGGLAWRLWSAAAPISVPAGALVLVLAAVATFGHLTRNLVVVFRQEPEHRNVVFWS